MSVQIITSRHTVNRLSDFQVDMVLEKDGVLYMPASFVMAFYVGEWSCEDAYVASCLDGQTTNCEISGSVISVYFNSPGFPVGQLKCRVFDSVDNAAFTDGTLDTCTPLTLPIEIVATAGDSEVISLYTDGYQPPATGIPKGDLEQSVQDTLDSVANKVDKENGKGLSSNDYTDADKEKVGDLPNASELSDRLGEKANAATTYTKTEVDEKVDNAGKVKSVSVNDEEPVQPDQNGNVHLEIDGGADVSVTTNEDGTFTIHVGETDYTINLNHTHENMAKIVKCTESTLPQTFENDTIYVQVDDASNPTEIESLYLFGLEFTGGGVPAGTPAITRPSGTTINLGENDGSGVSKTIEIKANSHITGDLTVGLDENSDLSFDTSNLPSGVTYNSGAGTLTIAQATAMQGVNITIVYSGSGAAEIDGGLVISGGGAMPKSVVVVVVEGPAAINAVKFTKQQIVTTDIYPSPNSRLEIDMQFDGELNNFNQSTHAAYFMGCPDEAVDGATKKFTANSNTYNTSQSKFSIFCWFEHGYNGTFYEMIIPQNLVRTRSVFNCDIVNAQASFNGVSTSTERKTTTMSSPLNFGGGGNGLIFGLMDIIVYSIKHYENNVLVHDYVPVTKNGVAGLYDNKTNTFIHSTTGTELEIVQ